MKDRKRRMEMFNFFEHTAIEKHLEKMAESGWMLEKIGTFFWYYRRMKPKKVHFKATYYPNASEFDPEPSEGEQTFREFCEHTGWIAAASSAQMLIFYNEQENPVPIETDPVLELETIHKAAKKNFLPSLILLLICGLMNGAMTLSQFLDHPVQMLARPTTMFSFTSAAMLLLICIIQLGGYFIWRRKALRVARQGEFLEMKSTASLQKILLIILLSDTAAHLFFMITGASSGIYLTVSVIGFVWVFVLIAIVNGMKNHLKRKKVSAKKNRAITLSTDFLLAFFFVGVLTYFIMQSISMGLFEKDAATYEYHGRNLPLYNDELPLTVEDLLTIKSDHYVKQRTDNGTVFLHQSENSQYARLDADDYRELPGLEYTITEVKLPFLYDFCKKQLLKEYDGTDEIFRDYYEPSAAQCWGAKEAYRVISPDFGPTNQYLLCFENRIAEVWADWKMTEEQMAIAGGKLRR